MNSSTTCWVIDANLAIWAFVPGARRVETAALLTRAGPIVVPTLWVYEVTSALRKTLWANPSWKAIVEGALGDILALPDEIFPPNEALVRAALGWSERLGHSKAYDAFYLALAERLRCEFWTGDRRLYSRARQVGAEFVRMPGG